MSTEKIAFIPSRDIIAEFPALGFFIAEKPTGIATHGTGDGAPGFLELATAALSVPLWAPHRLDRETSGIIIFAQSKPGLKMITRLFEQGLVEKKYLLVTDRDTTALSFPLEHHSHITKYRGRVVSWTRNKPPNATTSFRVIERSATRTLIEASPKTGKLHQIRLHAKDLGFPILGDKAHGGTEFERLMLHAAEVRFECEGREIVARSSSSAFL